MNEIWPILGYGAVVILAAAFVVFVALAGIVTEFDQGGFVGSLRLRRVFWAVACVFWAYECAFFLLELVWKTSPGKRIVVSFSIAIVVTGVMAIRGFRNKHRALIKP